MSASRWIRWGRIAPDRLLLVELCRRNAAKELDAARLAPLGDAEFRSAFVDLAGRHRVLGLVLSTLERAFARQGGLPGDGELADLLRMHRRRAALLEFRRDRVLSALRGATVDAVALKGAALAGSVYDEPCQRELSDLDLLVREGELKSAVRTLKRVGYEGPTSYATLLAYRRRHFHIPLRHPEAHIVEIHWALSRHSGPFQLDASRVRDHSLAAGDGTGSRTPRPEHNLLHIVLQNLQEGFSRLARVVDIDRIVTAAPAMDWDELTSTALRGEIGTATALSLQLARLLLGTAVPEEALRALGPTTAARLHLALLRPCASLLDQRLYASFSGGHLLNLWLVNGARMRLRETGRILVPDVETVAFDKDRPGPLRRLLGLTKLAFLQLYLYAAAAAAAATPSGRAQMRFWSSQASSSDRL